jgi:hypothetical protein
VRVAKLVHVLTVALAVACGHHAPATNIPPPVRIDQVVTIRGCLHDISEPKPQRAFDVVLPPICPPPFAACYMRPAGLALAAYLALLEQRVHDDIKDCTPAPDAGVDTTTTGGDR